VLFPFWRREVEVRRNAKDGFEKKADRQEQSREKEFRPVDPAGLDFIRNTLGGSRSSSVITFRDGGRRYFPYWTEEPIVQGRVDDEGRVERNIAHCDHGRTMREDTKTPV